MSSKLDSLQPKHHQDLWLTPHSSASRQEVGSFQSTWIKKNVVLAFLFFLSFYTLFNSSTTDGAGKFQVSLFKTEMCLCLNLHHHTHTSTPLYSKSGQKKEKETYKVGFGRNDSDATGIMIMNIYIGNLMTHLSPVVFI